MNLHVCLIHQYDLPDLFLIIHNLDVQLKIQQAAVKYILNFLSTRLSTFLYKIHQFSTDMLPRFMFHIYELAPFYKLAANLAAVPVY